MGHFLKSFKPRTVRDLEAGVAARAGLAAGAGRLELTPPGTRGQERGFELPKSGASCRAWQPPSLSHRPSPRLPYGAV